MTQRPESRTKTTGGPARKNRIILRPGNLLRLPAGIYQTGFRNCFEIVTPFHLSLSAFLGKNVYTIILGPIIVCWE